MDAAARHEIPVAQSLIDQMVAPKAKGSEPLLESRTADRCGRTGKGFRLATEMADKQRHVFKRCITSIDVECFAEAKY